MCVMLKPKEWLDENEWENKPIESELVSLYNVRYFDGRILQSIT